jgi:hypothetical protein
MQNRVNIAKGIMATTTVCLYLHLPRKCSLILSGFRFNYKQNYVGKDSLFLYCLKSNKIFNEKGSFKAVS